MTKLYFDTRTDKVISRASFRVKPAHVYSFDSKEECEFYRLARLNGVKLFRNATKFLITQCQPTNGLLHRIFYTPDFSVDNRNLYVEYKGGWWFQVRHHAQSELDIIRWSEFQKQHELLIVVDEKTYLRYEVKCRQVGFTPINRFVEAFGR